MASTPFAREVFQSHKWWEHGQLGNRPELTPIVVVAVDCLDAAIGIAERAYHERRKT